ncbi:Por secretion system C-terminal sorting domain-containing protein [Hymenobacter daecheongensis DSM 21074]|uniref:Por secretion system C-terminal sorting domain-containing protein n=1 Tax=Hymenobacter daecheongensis DSM 21074 TaxID=1121955 RepID=A0A1M6A9L1_9BACT|nr:T9SS type A sorting domain-containing protein [Hymenobacter daecheongensis]SHI33148.1 Por secretion system C-terminal sorting domain-containing protein [Hymenobacter daecheongensis DSM 21074]
MYKSVLVTLLLVGTTLGAQAQSQPEHSSRNLALAIAKHEVSATNPLQRLAGNTRLIQQLEQKQYRGAWADTLRRTYSRFTAADNPQSMLWEQASPKAGTPFRSIRLYRYTYNAAQKVALDTVYTFPAAGGINPLINEVNTYDAQGNLTQWVQQLKISGTWRNYARTTYTYNAANQPTLILDETYFGTAWENSSREVLTYDAQGRLTVSEFMTAQTSGPGFNPFFKTFLTYNTAGKVQTTLQQYYQGGAYVDDQRNSFIYNGTGQLQLFTIERYVSSAWVRVGAYQYTYDADGNTAQELYQTYNAATGTFTNNYRVQNTYQRTTATAATRGLAAGLTVVPNPATRGAAQLRYALPVAGPATVEVLDLTGRLISRLSRAAAPAATAQTVELSALNLRAGLYLVRLTASGQSQQTKLVVE